MSTTSPPEPAAQPSEKEIRIVSHSNLFYWWPVWAVGFLMAVLTFFDGNRLVVAPAGSKVFSHAEVKGEIKEGVKVTWEDRKALVLQEGKDFYKKDLKETGEGFEPRLRTASTSTYGVIFSLTVLLVIVITNVPLRGLWSVVIIITVVLLSVIFALADWWEKIFQYFAMLDIRINVGGYMFISLVLFAIWLVTFLFFDRQVYMIFTPGQLKVCTEIGGGEKAFDTMGMTIEKQRSDLFRHWILGLGSGDLIVNTSGAHVQHFDLPNVLFIGKKVQQIEDLLREKAVVRGGQ
jgi:hypothetical protein